MTEDRARRRRGHPAEVGRVLAGGASIAATLSLVAVMGAGAEQAADDAAAEGRGAEAAAAAMAAASAGAPGPVAPPAAPTPATGPPVTIVVRRHIVVGADGGVPTGGGQQPQRTGGEVAPTSQAPAPAAAPAPAVRPATPAPAPRRPAPAATTRASG
jgi:hypothetical protein